MRDKLKNGFERIRINTRDFLSETRESSDNPDNITSYRIVWLEEMFVDCWLAFSMWIMTHVAISLQQMQWETTYRTLCWSKRENEIFWFISTQRVLLVHILALKLLWTRKRRAKSSGTAKLTIKLSKQVKFSLFHVNVKHIENVEIFVDFDQNTKAFIKAWIKINELL